jgi:pilus assembly protein CpaB
MDKRMLVSIATGAILALIAILMIYGHLSRQEARIRQLIEEGKAIEVVVAKEDIGRETTISTDMVKLKVVPSRTLQPGDLTSLDSAVGKFAIADILKDQHLNSDVVKPFISMRFLSEGVPVGMRAITIAVDKLSAIEGLIKSQDKVDIIGTFSFPTEKGMNPPIVINLFQGVKVLAVNKNISQYRAEGKADTVTLALKPEDIKMLSYSLDMGGKLRLVLRAPLDTSEDAEYSALTFDGLLTKLGLLQQRIQPAPPITVEVDEGTKQKEVPISK